LIVYYIGNIIILSSAQHRAAMIWVTHPLIRVADVPGGRTFHSAGTGRLVMPTIKLSTPWWRPGLFTVDCWATGLKQSA